MKTKSIEALRPRKAHISFLILGPILIVLTGCASSPPVDEAKYNPMTGYPAVGGRTWHF